MWWVNTRRLLKEFRIAVLLKITIKMDHFKRPFHLTISSPPYLAATQPFPMNTRVAGPPLPGSVSVIVRPLVHLFGFKLMLLGANRNIGRPRTPSMFLKVKLLFLSGGSEESDFSFFFFLTDSQN